MTRLSNRLFCEGVGGGTAPQVQTFTYRVDVTDECEFLLLGMFDLNDDEAITVAGDLPVWLDAPVDFNGDAAADAVDMGLLLQATDMNGE